MYNIRIKQLPKNGDQRNYSLVDRNDLYIKVNPINQDSNVKNTISAVPREEANIEAEGGETVIGDINNDGFLEHNKIVGKRHTKGGVPLNVAPGSFIFSDTKKLKIKDPEVLSIFGITNIPTGGITPAKIANRYPMNNYMNILKDNDYDPISKRTASKMLENNLEKLGMLALVQESMKGFPDGIPAIAESVMAGLQGQQAPGQEQGEGVAHEVTEGQEAAEEGQMRYGGLTNYQVAGTTTPPRKTNKVTESGNPVEGFKFYSGITPVTVKKVEMEYGIENPNSEYITLSNGKRINKEAFQQLLNKGYYNDQYGDVGDTYTINQNVQKRTIKDSDGNPVTGFDLYSGDKFNYKGSDYTVANPNADKSRGYYNTMKPMRDMFDNTQGIVQVINNKTGKYEYIEAEDLGDAYKFDKSSVAISPNTSFRNAYPKTKQTRITNPGYQTVTGTYINQANEYNPNVGNRPQGERMNVTEEEAAVADGNTKRTIKENAPLLKQQKQVVAPAPAPVVNNASSGANNKKVSGKLETQKFIVQSGKYKGQEATAYKRGDTIRIYYPDGVHEAFLNGKRLEGYKYGGYLPKHQGTEAGVSSTVGDASSSSMMDDGSSNGFFGGIGDYFSDIFGGDNTANNASTSSGQEAINTTLAPTMIETTGDDDSAIINQIGNLFPANATPTAASQPAVAQTMQGIQNGAVTPVATGDPNQQVIVNNDPKYEFEPSSEKFLPYTSKAKSTYEPWKPQNYDKQWVPTATTAMANPEGAAAIDLALQNIAKSGKYGPNILNKLQGLTGQARYDKILQLATDGKPGPFHNAFLEAITPKPKVTEVIPEKVPEKIPEKIPDTVPMIPAPPPMRRRKPWWLQDQVNYAGAMTDTVNYYPPAMSQVDFETPGYVLEDPDRQIAAMQEAAARQTEAAMNSTAGNVAGASMAGQSDQRLGQSANIISDVQNRNVGTVNNALGRNSQITNQEKLTNEQYKQKYIADSATARQQYENAQRELKWRRLKAFNNGTSNMQRTNQLESMFPQYEFDRMNGNVAFTEGRQAYDENGNPLYDPYQNPMGSNNASSGSGYLSGKELATLKQQYIDAGFSEQQAIDLIKEQTGRASSSSRTRQNSVANQVLAGNTVPKELSRYGGYIKKYGGTVVDFGALPLYFFED